METFRMNWKVFLWPKVQFGEACPGLSGNPFCVTSFSIDLKTSCKKDWERRTDKGA